MNRLFFRDQPVPQVRRRQRNPNTLGAVRRIAGHEAMRLVGRRPQRQAVASAAWRCQGLPSTPARRSDGCESPTWRCRPCVSYPGSQFLLLRTGIQRLVAHNDVLIFSAAHRYRCHESPTFRESIRTAISVPSYRCYYEVTPVRYVCKRKITACIASCLTLRRLIIRR